MKIDRVVFGWDGNAKFADYVELNPRAYAKLGVKSTLIYCGPEELKCFPRDPGLLGLLETTSVPDLPDFRDNSSHFNWLPTLALLWEACRHPGEVIMTSGLDQIPLSRRFLDDVAAVPADVDIVVGFAGVRSHYETHSAKYGCKYYPSSHLAGRSEAFKEILGFSGDWEADVKKVAASRLPTMWNDLIGSQNWGLDEAYFSHRLAATKDVVIHEFSPDWWCDWCTRRIQRCAKAIYDYRFLDSGYYSEIHGDRPMTCDQRGFVERYLSTP